MTWTGLCTDHRSTSNGPKDRCATPGSRPRTVPSPSVSAIASTAHYGAAEGSYEAHATTLDYVVAATAG